MKSAKSWTRNTFSQRLVELARSDAAPAPAGRDDDPQVLAYRDAAAVVADFDPETLQPVGLKEIRPGGFTVILPDSERVIGGAGRRTLQAEVRAGTLRRLLAEDRLKAVVDFAQPRDGDHLHALLKTIADGRKTEVNNRSEAELSVALELAKQVGPERLGLPSAAEIRKELGRARLLAPMRHVADEHFQGRKRELEELRNYVEVAASQTVIGTVSRTLRDVLDLKKRPPLMIFGPGGLGKSALLSRFILEHAELAPEQRFPFAFLDFDRPGITAREPLTLLAEILFQLGAQFPSIQEECSEIRRDLRHRVAWAFHDQDSASSDLESYESTRERTSSEQERGMFISAAVSLFMKVTSGEQPLLLVLDTFEEVQYHSRPFIPELFDFLQQFQASLPKLRVVIAGRTRETGEKVKPLALEPLSNNEARAFLNSFGFPKKMAGMIVDKLGGNPLTLRLAMKVFERDGLDSDELDEIEGGRSFMRKVDDELVQGQLYRRFLNHIPDEEVRAVAHPGLVLRRLTPDLILNVLAGPCELLIRTAEEAQSLFTRLAKQDTLVTWEGSAIVHRSDVRRIMVELLRKAESKKVDAIHAGAVRHYEPFTDPVSRAEEIYHRYCLEQDESLIEDRWLAGIEDALLPAIGEIPESMRSHLAARTGGEVLSEQDWSNASPSDWELHAAHRARQFNEHGRYEDALHLLRSRKDRTDSSQLFNLEVVALARLGELEEAQKLGDQALVRVRSAGDRQQELELLGSLGSVARRRGEFEAAQHYLLGAAEIAEARGELIRSADSLVLALESTRWAGNMGSIEIRTRLSELSLKATPREMLTSPVLFSKIAREVEELNPEISALIRDVLEDIETAAFLPSQKEEMGTRTPLPEESELTMARAGQLYRLMNRLFHSEDELEEFLYRDLDTSLRSFSSGGSVESSNYEVITTLVRHGKTADLVTALQKYEPDNHDLVEIAHELGLKSEV